MDVESKTDDGVQTIKKEIDIKECSVKNVTVFTDRAEVNRLIDLDLTKGNVEVLLKGLPVCVDNDSIRVSCYGEATIVEVSFQHKAVIETESFDGEAEGKVKSRLEAEKSNIKASLRLLESNRTKHEQRMTIINKELSLLQNYADCISSSKDDKVGDILEKENIDNMLNFLSIYEEKSTNHQNEISSIKEKIEEIDKEVDVLSKNLSELEPKRKEMKYQRNALVLLDVKEEGNINLVASYVVSNASWQPLYDVRAFNKDSTVQILYFGMIQQSTGEDWENAKVSLSTALPSVGGTPPSLEPLILSIPVPVRERSFMKKKSSKMMPKMALMAMPPPGSARMASNSLFDNDSRIDELESLESKSAPFDSAQATENLTSTSFEIVRPATIESDNVEHKVSICQLEFSPQFEYTAIPKSVAHAFLKVKVKNDSNYALLAGDANVFLDNNFLTKTKLSAVSPMEEFDVSLGVDPSVKVTYKPVKKFQQRTGVLSKSDITDFHQVIEIKNTKSQPVKILVTDQCPRSTSDKIKVTLQNPDIKFPKSGSSTDTPRITNGNATLNLNNYEIEWQLEVAPSKTQLINLKYQVERPAGLNVNGM